MQTVARRQLLTLALAAGAAPAFIRHAGAADLPRFEWGVASGQPHARGMVLWTRLGGELPDEVNVTWQVAEDETFSRIAQHGVEVARAADAHCVHAEPAGLQPDRWYWYRFSALGQRSDVGRTRTAPAADAVVDRFDFAIASCQRYEAGHYAGWRHAAAEQLDAVLFLGDYIYEYSARVGGGNSANSSANSSAVRATHTAPGTTLRTLADYRQRYALTKSDRDLQAAHAAAPWLLVWDDHEVENDYAGLQGNRLQADFAAQRAAAYQAYWEHMPLPKAARPVDGSMRMHGSLDWGRLARVHLLDDRQQRDPQACPRAGLGGSNTVKLADCQALLDPRRTLLGAAQERWLAGNWSQAHPWNLLAQQTLMARASGLATTAAAEAGQSHGQPQGQYWTDGWDGYPAARDRLLATVAQQQVPGVVVLGGDVHANMVADIKFDAKAGPYAAWDDPAAPTVASEFCGTSMTSLGNSQARLDTVRRFNPHLHHARSDQRGYVRFTLRPDTLQAALRVLDDAREPASGIGTDARFVVEAAKPGIRAG